jgi:hypothetical protein
MVRGNVSAGLVSGKTRCHGFVASPKPPSQFAVMTMLINRASAQSPTKTGWRGLMTSWFFRLLPIPVVRWLGAVVLGLAWFGVGNFAPIACQAPRIGLVQLKIAWFWPFLGHVKTKLAWWFNN